MPRSETKITQPLPPFAVLFLTHFWDDFSDRQLARLMQVGGHGEVFVVVDEKGGPVLVRHPTTHVLAITEQDLADDGFLLEPHSQARWLNTDYNLYYFVERNPQYDYLILVEHDCVVTGSLDEIVEAMSSTNAEFVGLPMPGAVEHWYWTTTAAHYYDAASISGRLMGLTAYSRSLALRLGRERRGLRLRKQYEALQTTGSQIKWLNNEAFIGCELTRLGVRELSLSKFGDTSRYDWFPPTRERDLEVIPAPAFIHPCLDDTKVVASFVKNGWRPTGDTDRGNKPWLYLQSLTDQSFVNLFARHFAVTGDLVALNDLHAFCRSNSRIEKSLEIDLGLGRPATQSSVGYWSIYPNPSREAARAVDDSRTSHAVHTDFEENAWWCLDLERRYPISEIRVVLAMDPGEKPVDVVVAISNNLVEWSELTSKQLRSFDGTGLEIVSLSVPPSIPTRFVRVARRIPGHLRLHAVNALFAGVA